MAVPHYNGRTGRIPPNRPGRGRIDGELRCDYNILTTQKMFLEDKQFMRFTDDNSQRRAMLAVGFALLLSVTLPGCDPASETPANQADGSARPLKRIVCTTGIVGDLVRSIAGPDVEVQVLMGPGVDPHLFSPSPQDVEQMATADAIVYCGLHLEAGLASYLEKLSAKNDRVYELAQGVTQENLIPVGGGQYDPHFWNDLELWMQAAEGFANVISKWNPAQADQSQARAKAYLAMLQKLQKDSRQEVSAIPQNRRLLITAHDAFEYFGRTLGLEVAAVQGISTNTEASVKKVEEIVSRVVNENIPAVFAESSVSDKAIRAIIEGARQQGHDVEPGGVLYSDTLGPEGSGAETFEGMYRHNVDTIVSGLK